MKTFWKSRRKWLYIFLVSFTLCMLALCLFLIYLTVNYGSLASGLTYIAKYAFSDFGQLLYFSVVDNPYTSPFHTMYTPLNFLFYLPFALICCGENAFYALNNYKVETSAEDLAAYNSGIVQTWEFWFCILVYYVIIFTVLFFALKKAIPVEKLSDKVSFYFAMGFTTLIGYGFIRGSNVFIALAFFVGYLNWYKSDVRWKRELSLVFFAIAGTMKFYLLFSGILLLKDKRWLDALKCVAYVFICVFVPFLIYESPLDTIYIYLKNLVSFVGNEGRIGSATNISVYNLVYCFFSLFGVENTTAVTVICWIMTAFVFVAGLIICVKTNSRFSELMAMCCVFALVSPVSYLYLLSFFVLPFMVFMKERSGYEKKRKTLYTIIFFILMFIPIIVLRFFILYTCVLLVALVAELITALKKETVSVEEVASQEKVKQNN